MPPVITRHHSKFSLLFLKAFVFALAVLALVMLIALKPAAVATTVKPVLALTNQQITTPRLYPDLPPAILTEIFESADLDPNLQFDTTSPAQNLTPDDIFARQQWSMQDDQAIEGGSGLFGSYDYLTGGHDVVVAVIDSGFILQHEDLNFLPGYDFIHNAAVGNDGDGRDHDPSDPGDWVNDDDIAQQTVSEGCPVSSSKWHGTAIAGIIGATPYNSVGIAGGSPSVSMLPVRVTGKCGGFVSDLIDGIRWAAGLSVDDVADNQHPAQVINLSIGFPGSCSNALQQAIDDAANAGAVLVTAATNSAANLDNEPYSPASCNNVITVAAADKDGAITSYTALGESVFISAPGGTADEGIITTQNDGRELPVAGSYYGYHYGTSIAAAHVSATVANMLAYQPTLNQNEIRQVLSATATPVNFDPRCESGECGSGRLNAVAAMELLASDVLTDVDVFNDEVTEPDAVATVQTASADSTDNSPEILAASATSDAFGGGSTEWQNLLMLMLLLITQLYCKRRIQTKSAVH